MMEKIQGYAAFAEQLETGTFAEQLENGAFVVYCSPLLTEGVTYFGPVNNVTKEHDEFGTPHSVVVNLNHGEYEIGLLFSKLEWQN